MQSHARRATAVKLAPQVHSYIIDHDVGFAPNPFFGVCTLACCKPDIRLYAELGDYVIGTASKPSGRQGYLIYWMRVDEITTFDDYWADSRFRWKRPVMRGSRMQRYGDNIYHHDNGAPTFTQEDSFHSEPNGVTSVGNLERDTDRTDRVLLGRTFAYWGGAGPKIPDQFAEFVHKTQGRKSHFPPEKVEAFVNWVQSLPDRGFVSQPLDWPG